MALSKEQQKETEMQFPEITAGMTQVPSQDGTIKAYLDVTIKDACEREFDVNLFGAPIDPNTGEVRESALFVTKLPSDQLGKKTLIGFASAALVEFDPNNAPQLSEDERFVKMESPNIVGFIDGDWKFTVQCAAETGTIKGKLKFLCGTGQGGLVIGDSILIGSKEFVLVTQSTTFEANVNRIPVLLPSIYCKAKVLREALVESINNDPDNGWGACNATILEDGTISIDLRSPAGKRDTEVEISFISETLATSKVVVSNIVIHPTHSSQVEFTQKFVSAETTKEEPKLLDLPRQEFEVDDNEPVDVSSVLPDKEFVSPPIKVISFVGKLVEGRGDEYGAISQSSFFGSFANKCLDAVRTNKRDFIRIYGDKRTLVARAVLVSPTYLAEHLPESIDASFNVTEKTVAWLTDCAIGSITNPRTFDNNVIYAIVIRKVVNAKVYAGKIQKSSEPYGYLMSARQFESLIH